MNALGLSFLPLPLWLWETITLLTLKAPEQANLVFKYFQNVMYKLYHIENSNTIIKVQTLYT